MKRLLTILLALCIIPHLFSGCSSTYDTPSATSPTIASVGTDQSSATGTTEAQSIEVDKGMLFVDITLPNWFFEGEDMSTFNPDTYAEENEFKKAILNDDGSVTVTISKAQHTALMEETAASLKSSFNGYVESADTPYIKSITHSNDFKEVTISVARSDYESAFDVTPFSIGLGVMLYQSISGTEFHTEISVVDVDTGDVISTAVYPDDLQ